MANAPATHDPVGHAVPWDGDEAALAAESRRRNKRLLLILAAIGVGMFVFAFANVPIFGLLCQKLGFAQDPGKGSAAALAAKDGKIGRPIEVRFTGNVWGQLPVEFRPVTSIQQTNLGKMTVADYVFINLSRNPVYFRPIHSIRPTEAAGEDKYELGECFCYTEMMMHPGQELVLPVVYRFHNGLDENIKAITMSYTLFPITKEEYERKKAEEAAKEEQGS